MNEEQENPFCNIMSRFPMHRDYDAEYMKMEEYVDLFNIAIQAKYHLINEFSIGNELCFYLNQLEKCGDIINENYDLIFSSPHEKNDEWEEVFHNVHYMSKEAYNDLYHNPSDLCTTNFCRYKHDISHFIEFTESFISYWYMNKEKITFSEFDLACFLIMKYSTSCDTYDFFHKICAISLCQAQIEIREIADSVHNKSEYWLEIKKIYEYARSLSSGIIPFIEKFRYNSYKAGRITGFGLRKVQEPSESIDDLEDRYKKSLKNENSTGVIADSEEMNSYNDEIWYTEDEWKTGHINYKWKAYEETGKEVNGKRRR